jgi:hypothetical protein
MTQALDIRRRFSNNRQWREFIKAVQDSVTYPCSVTYPMVLGTLREAVSTSLAPGANKYCSETPGEIPPASVPT